MNKKNQDIICNGKVDTAYVCLKYTENISYFLRLREVSLEYKTSADKVYPQLSKAIEYINDNYRYKDYAFSRHLSIFDRGILWLSQGKLYDWFSGTNSVKSRRINGRHANIFKESSNFLKKRFFIENLDPVKQQKDWKKELAEKMSCPDVSVRYLPANGDLWLSAAKPYVTLLSMVLLVFVLTMGLYLLGY